MEILESIVQGDIQHVSDIIIANPEMAHIHNELPLVIALNEGQMEIANLLLEQGANPNDAFNTAVDHNREEAIRVLLEPPFHIPGFLREQALITAIANTSLYNVEYLIQSGIDVNAFDGEALILASQLGDYEVVELLLEAGGDVHIRSDEALFWAIKEKHDEVLRVLLEHGANVEARQHRALVYAVHSGYNKGARMLLDAGADPDKLNAMALVYAYLNNDVEMVNLLLERGAIPRTEHLQIMAAHGHMPAIRHLVDNLGVKINSDIFTTAVVLHHRDVMDHSNPLAVENYLAMIEYLLQNGADPFNEEAYQYAIDNDNLMDVADLIEEYREGRYMGYVGVSRRFENATRADPALKHYIQSFLQ